MRHFYSYRWLWRLAYAGQSANPCAIDPCKINRYESRWHHRGGGEFGVRRPLRYLSRHLDLDENQTRRMASVLNQLKTEREQATLDEKRCTASLAALLESGTPTLAEAREALTPRVESAEHLKEEVAKAMVAISSFLDDDQRAELVILMQTGSLSF